MSSSELVSAIEMSSEVEEACGSSVTNASELTSACESAAVDESGSSVAEPVLVSKAMLKETINDLLSKCDIDTVSTKSIRRQAELKLGLPRKALDVKKKKIEKYINQFIKRLIEKEGLPAIPEGKRASEEEKIEKTRIDLEEPLDETKQDMDGETEQLGTQNETQFSETIPESIAPEQTQEELEALDICIDDLEGMIDNDEIMERKKLKRKKKKKPAKKDEHDLGEDGEDKPKRKRKLRKIEGGEGEENAEAKPKRRRTTRSQGNTLEAGLAFAEESDGEDPFDKDDAYTLSKPKQPKAKAARPKKAKKTDIIEARALVQKLEREVEMKSLIKSASVESAPKSKPAATSRMAALLEKLKKRKGSKAGQPEGKKRVAAAIKEENERPQGPVIQSFQSLVFNTETNNVTMAMGDAEEDRKALAEKAAQDNLPAFAKRRMHLEKLEIEQAKIRKKQLERHQKAVSERKDVGQPSVSKLEDEHENVKIIACDVDLEERSHFKGTGEAALNSRMAQVSDWQDAQVRPVELEAEDDKGGDHQEESNSVKPQEYEANCGAAKALLADPSKPVEEDSATAALFCQHQAQKDWEKEKLPVQPSNDGANIEQSDFVSRHSVFRERFEDLLSSDEEKNADCYDENGKPRPVWKIQFERQAKLKLKATMTKRKSLGSDSDDSDDDRMTLQERKRRAEETLDRQMRGQTRAAGGGVLDKDASLSSILHKVSKRIREPASSGADPTTGVFGKSGFRNQRRKVSSKFSSKAKQLAELKAARKDKGFGHGSKKHYTFTRSSKEKKEESKPQMNPSKNASPSKPKEKLRAPKRKSALCGILGSNNGLSREIV